MGLPPLKAVFIVALIMVGYEGGGDGGCLFLVAYFLNSK